MSINEAKWTVFLSLCASRIASFLLLTFFNCQAGIVSNFFHSFSNAAFASGIFIAWDNGKNLWTKLKWVIELYPLTAMWSSSSFGWDDSRRCLLDSCDSAIHACFAFGILLDSQLCASVSWGEQCLIVPFVHGINSSTGTSNFLLTFLKVSLYSPFWQLDCRLLFFSLLSGFSNLGLHCKPHIFRSVVAWFVVSISPDHKNPVGGFSFNNVSFVNPVQESDKLRFACTFQKSSVRFSCNTSRFA